MFHKIAVGVVVVAAIGLAGSGLALADAQSNPAATPASAQSIKLPASYDVMDANHDMMVSDEEFHAALPDVNVKLVDVNGDGQVDRPEYMDFQEKVENGTWTNTAVKAEPVPAIQGYDDDPVKVVTNAPKGTLKDPYSASNPTVVKEGHDTFLQSGCSSCHGGNGGGGMCPPLTNGVWIYGNDHLDDKLFRLVALGSQQLQASGISRVHQETPALMPPQGGYTVRKAGDLWKIITWIKSMNNIQD